MDISFVDLAVGLAKNGREFNSGILNRFRGYFPEVTDPSLEPVLREHDRVIQCAAQTLSWLQPNIDDDEEEAQKLVRFYYDLMKEIPKGEKSIVIGCRTIRNRINGLRTRSQNSRKSVNPMKPARTEGIIRGLQTWAYVNLPVTLQDHVIDLRRLRKKVSLANSRVNWTALAPMKLYALDRPILAARWPEGPDPDPSTARWCYLPIGRRVSASIKRLFGIDFGESENDHRNALQLQVHIKQWANQSLSRETDSLSTPFSLLDINSGLQAFRSIDEMRR